MEALFLSIITINYNNAAGLRKTLESVRGQTSKNYEHIIIDGGSTDESVAVLEEFLADKDYAMKVTYWCSEKDRGIYDAMNKGIPHAGGRYCLFLNSGDYLADNEVVARFDHYNLTDTIIYTNIIFYNSKKEWKVKYPSKITLDYFYQRQTLSHQNTLFLTNYMKEHPYSLKYKIAGDVDIYWQALCREGINFTYIDDVISKYEHEFGLSTIAATKEIRNREWKMQIDEYIPDPIIRDVLENNARMRKELAVYEKCYHGILVKLKNILLKYSALKKRIIARESERH